MDTTPVILDLENTLATRPAIPREHQSVLATLAPVEKGALLDQMLTTRPDLREQAEEVARRQLVEHDRDAVAANVEWTLSSHDIDELNTRAGYHAGRG